MSQRMKIMAEAEEASLTLKTYDRVEGERKFKALIERHPSDGMIFFKRAQGYEVLDLPEKAREDYAIAETLFPLPEWRKLAKGGIARCEHELRLKGLPAKLRALWRDVGEEQPARSRAMAARAALERTVEFLIHDSGVTPRGHKLDAMLSTIKGQSWVPGQIIRDMETIKLNGDAAAHGEDTTVRDAALSHEASQRVVQFLIDRKRARGRTA